MRYTNRHFTYLLTYSVLVSCPGLGLVSAVLFNITEIQYTFPASHAILSFHHSTISYLFSFLQINTILVYFQSTTN